MYLLADSPLLSERLRHRFELPVRKAFRTNLWADNKQKFVEIALGAISRAVVSKVHSNG